MLEAHIAGTQKNIDQCQNQRVDWTANLSHIAVIMPRRKPEVGKTLWTDCLEKRLPQRDMICIAPAKWVEECAEEVVENERNGDHDQSDNRASISAWRRIASIK